ncbi:MAG: 50S ribosomal protein L25 [Pirellulales bacterium]|nr:50S ribosomal protein L25 [Pirellulales bacterium]
MAETLNVQIRETRGKRRARRQRAAGVIPGILYGHGEETVSLSVPAEQLDAAIRHGSRLVNLAGAVTEQAFIRELQWDTWGTHILHVDLTRVSAHEKVEVRVAVELRGEAPGVKQGGIVEQPIHELDIECEVSSIPEKIEVNINHLELDQSITVADLKLPPTVRVLEDATAVVVQCNVPAEEAEPAEGVPAEGAEPELIGRKKTEEGEEE